MPEGLHQDVADGCRLNGSGMDGPSTGIRGELAKQGILGSPAHNVDRLDRCTQNPLEAINDPSVFERQAFQAAADHRSFITGRNLASSGAECSEPCGHISMCKEAHIIGIDQGGERGSCLRPSRELLVRPLAADASPHAAAFLNKPKAHDVLQKPRCPRNTPLIRKIEPHRFGVDHRVRNFNTQE